MPNTGGGGTVSGKGMVASTLDIVILGRCLDRTLLEICQQNCILDLLISNLSVYKLWSS